MIRMITFNNRKPGISWEEYSRHWRDVHGPLLRDTPSLAKYVKFYTQHHIRPASDVIAAHPSLFEALPFDGFSEVAYKDVETFQAMLGDPEFAKIMTQDEEQFLDMHSVKAIMIEKQYKIIE